MIDLSKLAEPFDESDIEWRVSRAGTGSRGIWCCVIAYITARAIQERLDEVCGPDGWRNESPRIIQIGDRPAFVGGISIRMKHGPDFGDQWVTKWDVSEPTQIEPAKGGFSGAMKRAGAQWGIGRYLYHLDETFAEVAETGGKGWHYATLKKTGETYYWKPPQLPGWALPKDSEVSQKQLNDLKREWRDKFGSGLKQAELVEGFSRFVASVCGEFPVSDHKTWTVEALETCSNRIAETTDPGGVSPDVPFEE